MSVADLGATLGLVLAGYLGLKVFYKAFETTWPERYYDGVHGADPLVSRSSFRYGVFRIGPLFLALIAVGTAAQRLDLSRDFVAWATTITYTGLGPARMAAVALLARPLMLGRVIHRTGTSAGLLLAAMIYNFTGNGLDHLVPSAKDAIFALWIALLVFVLGRLAAIIPARQPSIEELVKRGVDEIDVHLLVKLDEADPGYAFKAIALAENLNRPPWVRRFERILVRRNGSYGLMQMKAELPISDEESVRIFIESNRKFVGRESWDPKQLERFFRKHNASEEFVSLATKIYWRVL